LRLAADAPVATVVVLVAAVERLDACIVGQQRNQGRDLADGVGAAQAQLAGGAGALGRLGRLQRVRERCDRRRLLGGARRAGHAPVRPPLDDRRKDRDQAQGEQPGVCSSCHGTLLNRLARCEC
jgi:hypothetical protein